MGCGTLGGKLGTPPSVSTALTWEYGPMTKPGRKITNPVIKEEQDALDASTPVFGRKYPMLWKFFQKKQRSPGIKPNGCITLFYEDFRFKLCVNDRPNNRSLFVSAKEPADAFALAEQALSSDRVGWRSYKGR